MSLSIYLYLSIYLSTGSAVPDLVRGRLLLGAQLLLRSRAEGDHTVQQPEKILPGTADFLKSVLSADCVQRDR